MPAYDQIIGLGMDNHGIVTAAQARALGVSYRVLAALVSDGRLLHRGYGVFKLAFASDPDGLDRYAEALALAGPTARIHGESVLAMLDLALVNPPFILTAVSRRVRRTLPPWVRLVRVPPTPAAILRGLPCQPLADAFRSALPAIPPDRLPPAIRRARAEGWLSAADVRRLRKAIHSAAP
ncbi:MAG: type IV toxin-antitoxin system AbiEi family antitoxin domain-containing protein [Kiritimatiellae bacterium]|nr:type IV toxin-antitoxin system AbiEi family antitoxin domain-containing protein [Kiritimatiellia bacterium]